MRVSGVFYTYFSFCFEFKRRRVEDGGCRLVYKW
jgi:hypothetical protein